MATAHPSAQWGWVGLSCPPQSHSLCQGTFGVCKVDGGAGAQQLLQVARNQLLLQPLQLPGQSHRCQLLLGRRLLHGALWGGGGRQCYPQLRVSPPPTGRGAVTPLTWICSTSRISSCTSCCSRWYRCWGVSLAPNPSPSCGDRKERGGHRVAEGAQSSSGSQRGHGTGGPSLGNPALRTHYFVLPGLVAGRSALADAVGEICESGVEWSGVWRHLSPPAPPPPGPPLTHTIGAQAFVLELLEGGVGVDDEVLHAGAGELLLQAEQQVKDVGLGGLPCVGRVGLPPSSAGAKCSPPTPPGWELHGAEWRLDAAMAQCGQRGHSATPNPAWGHWVRPAGHPQRWEHGTLSLHPQQPHGPHCGAPTLRSPHTAEPPHCGAEHPWPHDGALGTSPLPGPQHRVCVGSHGGLCSRHRSPPRSCSPLSPTLAVQRDGELWGGGAAVGAREWSRA